MEEFKLEQQDPKRDEHLENQEQQNRAHEELLRRLETESDVEELVELIYESGDQNLIDTYNNKRLQHLQSDNIYETVAYSYTNPTGEVTEVGINNLDLQTVTGIDPEGYLLDADQNKTDTHITQIDHKVSDEAFINTIREDLISAAKASSNIESTEPTELA